MRALFGPVESLGHPFYPHPKELLKERQIGDHEIVCFSTATMEQGYWWEQLDDIDALVVWDPMWVSQQRFFALHAIADQLKLRRVGIYGDWSAGWHARGIEYAGAFNTMRHFDAVLTCRAGAVAMKDVDVRVLATPNLLTYGRLVDRGGDDGLVLDWPSQEDREVDVCFVGSLQSAAVPLRPFMLEQLAEICDRNRWTLDVRRDIPWAELEGVLLNSKVCFNWSLGTTLNCRVYEAAAAGCALVTDAHCIDNNQIAKWARFFSNEGMLEVHLDFLLRKELSSMRTGLAWEATRWAVDHSPMRTWISHFDRIDEALQTL